MPSVTAKFLEPYIVSNVRHQYYADSVDMADALQIHSDGKYPEHLIETRRPGETKEIQEYRKKTFEPITKPVFSKVYNTLMKIRKSGDWLIQFPKEYSARIAQDESPEAYLMRNFPKHGSITNWMFAIAFKKYLTDANSCVFTYPLSLEVEGSEYLKPYPRIFDAAQVLDYRAERYFVLLDEEPIHYENDGNYYTDGGRYWVIQPDTIQAFDVYRVGGAIREVLNIENPLGYMPVRFMYGVNVAMSSYTMLNESRLNSIVPKLNIALRESSDLDAEIVQHIHSTMWSLQPQQCQTCRGIGTVPRENSAPISCPGCGGKGLLPLNPYEHLVIAPPRPGEPQIPTPPMGYVEKDTGIARLQDERIKQHIYDALSSINMEYLAEVPMSQSGVSKQVDREELNSFVHSIAEDVVRIMDQVAYDCCAWRYMGLTYDIQSLLPFINVPDRFDMLNGNVLIDELTRLSQANVDPAIINAAQMELVGKKFHDEMARDAVILQLKLDPFAGVSVDELASAKTFDAISQTDFVIHSNISKFIHRALQEIPEFAKYTYMEQMSVLSGYAAEQITPERAPLGTPDTGLGGVDDLGKLPLALQQLGLAATRADELGDTALSSQLRAKMKELTKTI